MATWIERAQAIIEATTGAPADAPQGVRIGQMAFIAFPGIVREVQRRREPYYTEDPLTNEEKAHVFVQAFRGWGHEWIKEASKQQRIDADEVAAEAEAELAAADL
jgi:hypothetical protein